MGTSTDATAPTVVKQRTGGNTQSTGIFSIIEKRVQDLMGQLQELFLVDQFLPQLQV